MKILVNLPPRTNTNNFSEKFSTKINAKINAKIGILALGLCLIPFGASAVNAQERDPFRQPIVRVPVRRKAVAPSGSAAKKNQPVAVAAPPIQTRIDNYKTIRQRCAELGVQCPKPTSVLTIDEMNVTGVFRTPRGYAAMVQATPIKLSYTIYPGEKFYDGQLVAIEESKLVFRRVVQMSDGKEIVSASNKALRQAGVSGMASSRTEAQSPAVNPTVAVPNGGAAAATNGISAEAVPLGDQGEQKETIKPAAATLAPPVKLNQLPENNRPDGQSKITLDEKPTANQKASADKASAKKPLGTKSETKTSVKSLSPKKSASKN